MDSQMRTRAVMCRQIPTPRRVLSNAVAEIGGANPKSAGKPEIGGQARNRRTGAPVARTRFRHPSGGMVGPGTRRVVMTGRRDW